MADVPEETLTHQDNTTHDETNDAPRPSRPKRMTLDQRSRLSKANNRTTRFEYDDLNLLAKITLPDATTIEYVYDPNKNLIEEKTRNNTWYSYAYDELDRLIDVVNPLGVRTARYQYDLGSNVAARTDALGRTTRYSYDVNDRLASQTDALAADAQTPTP